MVVTYDDYWCGNREFLTDITTELTNFSKEVSNTFWWELWSALLSKMCKQIKREIWKICVQKYKFCRSFSEVLVEVVSVGIEKMGTFSPDLNCRCNKVEKCFGVLKK